MLSDLDPAEHAGTRLLDEPFAQAAFNLFVGKGAVDASIFETSTDLVEYVQVVLDIFDGAVVWEFVQ